MAEPLKQVTGFPEPTSFITVPILPLELSEDLIGTEWKPFFTVQCTHTIDKN